MNLWVISDRHHNHKFLVEHGHRPADYGRRIIANCQQMIKPEDIVIDLGDVIFSRASELAAIQESLPGFWILKKGNHDHEKDAWYLKRGFDLVVDKLQLSGVMFTHEPATELAPGTVLNVHGHLHNDTHRLHEYDLKPWHRLLALELTDYKPVLFTELHKLPVPGKGHGHQSEPKDC